MAYSKLTIAFGFLVLLGFLWQSVTISVLYFNYKTISQLNITIPVELALPDLSICFRYADILDRERFRRDKNITLPYPSDSPKAQLVQATVTVADIFNYSPTNESLIKNCQFRDPGKYDLLELSSESDCDRLFAVDKFYLQEYICYRISQNEADDSQVFSFKNVAKSLSWPGLLYSITFNESRTFRGAQFFKAMVHSKPTLPFRSAALAPVVNRLVDVSSPALRATYNLFELTYSVIQNSMLERPYQNPCQDYSKFGFTSANDCMAKCLIRKVNETFNKLPFSVIIAQPVDVKHVSSRDLDSRARDYISHELECVQECSDPDCYYDITLTRVNYDVNLEDNEMRFEVYVPREPMYKVIIAPRLRVEEYLIYLFSCFGIWFGTSVLSLNPFENVARWFAKRNSRTSNANLNVQGATSSNVRKSSKRLDVLRNSRIYGNRSLSKASNVQKTFCVRTRRALRNEMSTLFDQVASEIFGRHATIRRVRFNE